MFPGAKEFFNVFFEVFPITFFSVRLSFLISLNSAIHNVRNLLHCAGKFVRVATNCVLVGGVDRGVGAFEIFEDGIGRAVASADLIF